MGQTSSGEAHPFVRGGGGGEGGGGGTGGGPEWAADVQRQAATIKDLAFLTYDNFLSSLKELNKISHSFPDSNGKRLVFAVKKGTDTTLLWKATIKVGCVRVNAQTKQIESYRLLNLKQFLQVYKMILYQVKARDVSEANVIAKGSTSSDYDNANCIAEGEPPLCMPLTASVLLDKIGKDPDGEDPLTLDECCICMERKPEVILPCAHNYCLPCIEQWNVSSKTCPVCREEVENTDDSWVISEAPDSSEMAAEVQKLLNGLSESCESS